MNMGFYAPNWLGDAVLALGFVNEYQRFFPEDSIDVVAKSWVAPVFEHHPYVQHLQVLGRKDLRGLVATTRSGRHLGQMDLDRFYLLSDSFRSAYLAWIAHFPVRIGYSGQGRSPLLTDTRAHTQKNRHRGLKYRSLVNPKLMDQNLFSKDDIGITLVEEESLWARREMEQLGMESPIGICPFSVAESRTIPEEKWVDILQVLDNEKRSFLLFGGSDDKERGEHMVRTLGDKNIQSRCGHYSLRKSIALMSQCSGVIAVDSGLGHVAANLGLKTVSIFGAGNSSRTRPLGASTRVVNEDVYCSPCEKNECPNKQEPLICLHSITAQAVWGAFDSMALERPL